jgi:hypothetical protein
MDEQNVIQPTEQPTEQQPLLQDWQIKAVLKLIEKANSCADLHEGSLKRFHLESNDRTWVYQTITIDTDDEIWVDQTDLTEKYQNRINLKPDQLIPFLSILFAHYLADEDRKSAVMVDDSLADLDDHPF